MTIRHFATLRFFVFLGILSWGALLLDLPFGVWPLAFFLSLGALLGIPMKLYKLT